MWGFAQFRMTDRYIVPLSVHVSETKWEEFSEYGMTFFAILSHCPASRVSHLGLCTWLRITHKHPLTTSTFLLHKAASHSNVVSANYTSLCLCANSSSSLSAVTATSLRSVTSKSSSLSMSLYLLPMQNCRCDLLFSLHSCSYSKCLRHWMAFYVLMCR